MSCDGLFSGKTQVLIKLIHRMSLSGVTAYETIQGLSKAVVSKPAHPYTMQYSTISVPVDYRDTSFSNSYTNASLHRVLATGLIWSHTPLRHFKNGTCLHHYTVTPLHLFGNGVSLHHYTITPFRKRRKLTPLHHYTISETA